MKKKKKRKLFFSAEPGPLSLKEKDRATLREQQSNNNSAALAAQQETRSAEGSEDYVALREGEERKQQRRDGFAALAAQQGPQTIEGSGTLAAPGAKTNELNRGFKAPSELTSTTDEFSFAVTEDPS